MAVNRFDWMNAVDADALKIKSPEYRRCRTALRFERVVSCKCRGLDQRGKDAVLNLLAVEFTEHDAPAGIVTMTFSGGGAIRLEVECLEAELVDLGEVFAAMACSPRRNRSSIISLRIASGASPGRGAIGYAARGRSWCGTAKTFISNAMMASVAA
jgi:hypothetical protein